MLLLFFFSFSDSFLFLLNNIKFFVWCIKVHRPFAVTVLLTSRTITVYLLLKKQHWLFMLGFWESNYLLLKFILKKKKKKMKQVSIYLSSYHNSIITVERLWGPPFTRMLYKGAQEINRVIGVGGFVLFFFFFGQISTEIWKISK